MAGYGSYTVETELRMRAGTHLAPLASKGAPRNGGSAPCRRRLMAAARLLCLLSLSGAVFVVPTPAAAASQSTTGAPDRGEQPAWMVRLNEYRAAYGAPPAAYDAALSATAVEHSNYMAYNYLHAGPDVVPGEYLDHQENSPTAPDGSPNPYYHRWMDFKLMSGLSPEALEAREEYDRNGMNNNQLTIAFDIDSGFQSMLGAPFHLAGLLSEKVTRIGAAIDTLDGSRQFLSFLASTDPSLRGQPWLPTAFPGPGKLVDVFSYSSERPDPLQWCPDVPKEQAGLPMFFQRPAHMNLADMTVAITYTGVDGVVRPVGSAPDGSRAACVFTPTDPHGSGGSEPRRASGVGTFIIPRAHLGPGRVYTVQVRATDADTGEDASFTWSFTTVKPTAVASVTAVDAPSTWTAMVVTAHVRYIWPAGTYTHKRSMPNPEGTLYLERRPSDFSDWLPYTSWPVDADTPNNGFATAVPGTSGSTTQFRARFIPATHTPIVGSILSPTASAAVPSIPPPPPPVIDDPVIDEPVAGSLTGLRVSATTVTAGTALCVTGRLSAGTTDSSGETVRLRLRPAARPGTLVTVATTTTSTAGRFTICGGLPEAGALDIHHPASATIRAATAGAPHVQVRARLSWATSATSTAGRITVIPVTVRPGGKRLVSLQQYKSGKWRTLVTAATVNGVANLRYTFTTRGIHTLRATTPATNSAATGTATTRMQHVR